MTPTQPVVAILTDVPIAATGWGVTIKEADGSVYRARTTVGVAKVSTSTWSYTGPPVPEVGTYVLVWDDGGAPTPVEATEELIVTGPTVGDISPSVDDVAVVMRARTRDRAGNEGAFTSTTRPTAAEVDRVIALVTAQVQAEVGPDIPPVIAAEARAVILDGVAARLEDAYWPEQNQGPDSPGARHAQWYRDGLTTLGKSRAAYTATATRGGGMNIGSLRVVGGTATSSPLWPWPAA